MKKEVLLYPKEKRMLKKVGEQIKLARLRRKLSTSLVAERAKISRATLWKIENGDPTVSMGAYLSVLFAIDLAEDILFLAREDEEGRKLQDQRLLWKGEQW
ncbi:MAG: helix-turn-helix transcriptional regulator [Spirochaetes bacterium]|uniref:Helix-turn-helix transcriptional regulator n=1 Tax=Candidatus Ornithospirochaeta stercoravium TaxID=2840897 RepID=A0A9D9IBU5_9SPIO|nr:helix-turn-helix transcriptional regulator [Candidatus Ornithospirochaeta stercoravium]